MRPAGWPPTDMSKKTLGLGMAEFRVFLGGFVGEEREIYWSRRRGEKLGVFGIYSAVDRENELG